MGGGGGHFRFNGRFRELIGQGGGWNTSGFVEVGQDTKALPPRGYRAGGRTLPCHIPLNKHE